MTNHKDKERDMKIKENLNITTTDFWYDITDGGYLEPSEILEDEKDIIQVKEAIKTLIKFRDACEENIDGFFE